MSTGNKKETSARLMSNNEEMFRCPICSAPMRVAELSSLICENRHCFDLAKQGYINLLSQGHKTKYDKKLFEARRTISDIGFFDPLIDAISDHIGSKLQGNQNRAAIMDAGCGEGSHLAGLQRKLVQRTAGSALGTADIVGIGIDIAKEGVLLAAKADTNTIWCVADLANCPIADKQFSYILNILSPSNYSEFQRLLADDGEIIKVIPESGYLQELRELFYEQSDRETYSNEKVVQHFSQSFKLESTKRVQYTMSLDQESLKQLIYMTPLSWGASETVKEGAFAQRISQITCDFTILIGKKA